MNVLLNTDLGPYHLVEVIGRGGSATVYKAYQAALDRFVAVKVLDHPHDREFIARFKAEARIVAQLHHPNILPIYDYGEHAGLFYLVTQYVEQGASLADVAKPMPLAAALQVTARAHMTRLSVQKRRHQLLPFIVGRTSINWRLSCVKSKC